MAVRTNYLAFCHLSFDFGDSECPIDSITDVKEFHATDVIKIHDPRGESPATIGTWDIFARID